MFQVKFDGSRGMPFPGAQMQPTQVAAHRAAVMARISVSRRAQVHTSLIEWFGAGADQDAILLQNIRKMFEVANDDARTVTFVDGRTHDLHVDYTADNIFAPPTLHDQNPPRQEMALVLNQIRQRGATAPSTTKAPMTRATHLGAPTIPPGQGAGGFYGYAFPIDNRGTGAPTVTHQGSGMRIYLGNAYFGTGVIDRERAQTIYHEMTHKVIGTNDHFYGPVDCRNAALNDAQRARRNADSFGYFVTSLDGHVW